MEITKDAEKLADALYKEYKKRRKSGMSKEEAMGFDEDWASLFPEENADDLHISLNELEKAFNLQVYYLDSFTLSNELIAYEEKKPIKLVEKVVDTALKFRP